MFELDYSELCACNLDEELGVMDASGRDVCPFLSSRGFSISDMHMSVI